MPSDQHVSSHKRRWAFLCFLLAILTLSPVAATQGRKGLSPLIQTRKILPYTNCAYFTATRPLAKYTPISHPYTYLASTPFTGSYPIDSHTPSFFPSSTVIQPWRASALSLRPYPRYRQSAYKTRYAPYWALLLGGVVGNGLCWQQENHQVKALGYEAGYWSIHAFEETITWLENRERRLSSLLASVFQSEESKQDAAEILYNTATQLLFDVQRKILECKTIALATGYPLWNKDWQRYKQVRERTESLIQRLCIHAPFLSPIDDMQELEDDFFRPQVDDKNPIEAYFTGAGKALLDAPKNVFNGVKSILLDWPVFIGQEIAEQVNDNPELRQRVNQYDYNVRVFAQAYEKNEIPSQEMPKKAIDLVLEGYNLHYHIYVHKLGRPSCLALAEDVQENRKPLHDEFCLSYNRKWAIERFGEAFEQMSPAQRVEFISYTMTSIVANALLLEFIGDLAGLGDLEKLGKNSHIGRWMNRIKGGPAFFNKIKNIHKLLRARHFGKIKAGAAIPRKVRIVSCAGELREAKKLLALRGAKKLLKRAGSGITDLKAAAKFLGKKLDPTFRAYSESIRKTVGPKKFRAYSERIRKKLGLKKFRSLTPAFFNKIQTIHRTLGKHYVRKVKAGAVAPRRVRIVSCTEELREASEHLKRAKKQYTRVAQGVAKKKRFTINNYKRKFKAHTDSIGTTPKDLANYQVHHLFPQQHAAEFAKHGINVHHPHFLTWVEKSQHNPLHHSKNAAKLKYNKIWENLLNDPKTTPADILKTLQALVKAHPDTLRGVDIGLISQTPPFA